MRAYRWALACIVVSLLVPSAASAANTWAGTWDSSFGKMTLDAGGSGNYEGFSPGTLQGKVTGNVDEGTWMQPGDPPKKGTFKFTMSGDGQSFTGDWAYESGGCGTACGWNGRCVAGACKNNGTAPPVSLPPITPANKPPALGKVTAYAAPAPGTAGKVPLPQLPKKARKVTGDLNFVDGQGQALPPPTALAIEAHLLKAGTLCYFFIMTRDLHDSLARQGRGPNDLPDIDELIKSDTADDAFLKCVQTVTLILARNDELKRQRGTGTRSASAAARPACASLRPRPRRAKIAPRLRVTCKPTATGVRVTIRPRSAKQTLRAAMGGRAPKLVVGRSATGPPAAGARLNALWRAPGR